MDDKRRRQRLLLGGLLTVLGAVVAYQLWPSGPPASSAAAVARPRTDAPRGARRTNEAQELPRVVEVGVGRLLEVPPSIEASDRNPFRFRPKVTPPPPRPPPSPDSQVAVSTAPSGPPPPPPISLKFIGMVTGESHVGRVAVLSDGKFVYYGREGDIIDGRYRVVKIGEESLQMEYVDGRGRQTIRLSGA